MCSSVSQARRPFTSPCGAEKEYQANRMLAAGRGVHMQKSTPLAHASSAIQEIFTVISLKSKRSP